MENVNAWIGPQPLTPINETSVGMLTRFSLFPALSSSEINETPRKKLKASPSPTELVAMPYNQMPTGSNPIMVSSRATLPNISLNSGQDYTVSNQDQSPNPRNEVAIRLVASEGGFCSF